jgi:hypothetical protein
MVAAGDVILEQEFQMLPASKNATAAIAKGDIVTLSAGRKWTASDKGPYGVARQTIASGADMKGKVVVDGPVYVVADDVIDQFKKVVPTAAAKVSECAAMTGTLTTGTDHVTLASGTTLAGGIPPEGWPLGTSQSAAAADGDLIIVDIES